MSDRQPDSGHSARLLRGLIWGGVGLAPIAALMVLIGGDGPGRIAVLLVTVSVVLLGASLLIRNDPVLLRLEIEDGVAAQISALREEMRAEMQEELAAVAARTPIPPLPPMPSVPQKPMPSVPQKRAPGTTTGGRAVAAATPVPGQRGLVSGAVRPPQQPIKPQQPNKPQQPVKPQQPGMQTGSVVRSASVRAPMAPVFRAAPAPMSAEPHGPQPAPAEGVYGRPRPIEPEQPPQEMPPGEQSGRRRADVTATDIGYTGRRSKGSHAASDDHVVGPEVYRTEPVIYEDPGYDESQGYDYVDGEYPPESGEFPQQNHDGDYGYRDPAYRVNPYETGSFGEPDPGYPGWTDVDERQVEERVPPRGGRRR